MGVFMNKNLILLTTFGLIFLIFSCDESSDSGKKLKPAGTDGGPCYIDGTCDDGFECNLTMNTCFEVEETDDFSAETEDGNNNSDNEETPDLPDSQLDEDSDDDEIEGVPGIGKGIKVTGDIILFHATVFPDGSGGSRDISSMLGIGACPIEGDLQDDNSYGSVSADLSTLDIAESPPTSLTTKEDYVQMKHSFSGTMGSATLTLMEKGMTLTYLRSYGGSVFVNADDNNIVGNSISYEYFMTLRCLDPIETGSNLKVGPFQDSVCSFFVMKPGTNGSFECMYAVGFSSLDEGIGSGVSIVEQ